MHPKTRPVDWWKTKLVLKLYRRAGKAMSADAWPDFILEFENGSNRRKNREDKIRLAEAQEVFVFLQRFSHSAEERGIEKDIIIIWDYRSQTWRGKEVNLPDGTMGITRKTMRNEQLKDSYKARLGDIEPCSREEMIEHICERYKCDIERAGQIFATASKASRAILYHRATNTWRGCHSTKMPTPTDTVKVEPTDRQAYYRERYGKMLPLFHDYINPEQSPRLKWIAELDGCSIADAAKTHHDAWNVSKDKSKLAWRRLPKGVAVGVDYVEPFTLTDEQIRDIENMTGCWAETFERKITEKLSIKSDRVKSAIIEIEKLGLTVRFEHSKDNKKGEVVGGKKWNDERLTKEAAGKAEKEERERQEADRIKAEADRIQSRSGSSQ
jgi:hypothetical protein